MEIKFWFGSALLIYLVIIFRLALKSRSEINVLEDYVIAGRNMGLGVATATLFGTWFGAGTLLAATDEVTNQGLLAIAIEPLGAGFCLIVAGLLLAKPLWEAKLLTLADYYRQRFGPKAELIFSISIFTYFGWIAAQLVGMAGILNVFFELPMWLGILATASIAVVYTTLGGMWSVAKTDAIQIALLLGGLIILAACVIVEHGSLLEMWQGLDPKKRTLIPTEDLRSFMGWMNLLLIGTLGNLPGSDLMQRVFAARTPQIAQRACILAGVAYLILGSIPILMGLYGSVYLDSTQQTQVISNLIAGIATNPDFGLWVRPIMVLTLLALISAVLSTLDSAMLTTASVITQNLIIPRTSISDPVRIIRFCVVVVGLVSVGFAFAGKSAFELLEGSYAMTMAGPLAPLVLGVYFKFGSERAAVVSLSLGYLTIFVEIIADMVSPGVFDAWLIPLPIAALSISLLSYLLVSWVESNKSLG